VTTKIAQRSSMSRGSEEPKKQIRCPLCGHISHNRIEFGSHVRRCKAMSDDATKFDWDPKHKLKRKRNPKRK
jgi:ribosomal protein L37AE/L43A